MVDRSELITVCRQIGGMMEAGVDILRITRVLRAQTENPRLLEVYNQIDRDLRMGYSIADAMSHAPDVFSPFAVSLVQQGEMRNDMAGAFLRVADFLQKEEEVAADLHLHDRDNGTDSVTPQDVAKSTQQPVAPSSDSQQAGIAPPLTVIPLDNLIDWLQAMELRVLRLCGGLLLALAAIWWSAQLGVLEQRWLSVTLYSVAAAFIGGAGLWRQRRIEAERQREIHCSFCGRGTEDGVELQSAPHLRGAAICSHCAATMARGDGTSEGTQETTVASVDVATAGFAATSNGSLHGELDSQVNDKTASDLHSRSDASAQKQTSRVATSPARVQHSKQAASEEEDYESDLRRDLLLC